ncbi:MULTISPECIES: hypothetical protein [Pseudomonas]|uniref:Uncharacterized protein n=1 Tax=Pseudomonas triticicola TaxID=2842345 RepID=A0ABS6RHR7_9PSED|nr:MULTISPECIES: hypothetical protein [Pseudomonas]MBV4545674.1 hypothetical protein [Pseudomonas triticicola]MDH2078915.1 hypothetical protein [Pseudomonas atacamensis]
MSYAARAYTTIFPVLAPTYLSATINGDANPLYRFVKIPQFMEFRSTSVPSFGPKPYPEGLRYVLTAGHTKDGVTRTLEFVFPFKPQSLTYDLSKDSDDVRSTYYSNPATGDLHVSVSGSLTLKYDDIEKTLSGTWSGTYDHGGENGNEEFPITGEFVANADLSKRKNAY